MGLYIPKIEMPKDNCEAIRQITITNNWIDGEMKILAHDSVTNEFIGEVVEVPEPHGRLIDADELLKKHFTKWTCYDAERIGTAPTVIEAEE